MDATIRRITRSPSMHLVGLIGTLAVGGVIFGMAALRQPAIAGGLLAVLIVIVAVWHRRTVLLPQLFLLSLAILLGGYAIIGRGFAHIGVRLFYVGEVVLFLGALATVFGGGIRPVLRSPVLMILVSFMGWCLFRTLPYLEEYGVTALRDGATWGYAAFALLIAGILLRRGPRSLPQVLTFYQKIAPWIVGLVPILIMNSQFHFLRLPAPGSGTNLLDTKPGPMSVQLAGVGVFLALGLHRLRGARARPTKPFDVALLVIWLLVALITAILNRGGMLSMGMAFLVVLVLRPSKQALRMLGLGALLFGVLLVLDPKIQVQGGKEYSSRQLVENFLSVFDIGTGASKSNTRQWRLDWWETILDYTIFGPYFWTGKGFGINLAVSDGIYNAVDEDGVALRSPHNSHMTILARAGVPGFLLWILFLSMFGLSLLQAYFRARRAGEDWIARIDLWLLAFWIAFLTNMSFTVYLEGPHGGIWFWSLIGFGVAFMEWQRSFGVDNRSSSYPIAPAARYTASRVS